MLLIATCLALATVRPALEPRGELWEALPAALAEKARGAFRQRQLKEADGGTLQADAAGLARRRRGQTTAVGCTLPEGPGTILDLAADPAGLVFVAAEHGLFLISPDVDVLDPVTLGEGAPPGHVRSVHVDGARRLWIATDEAFGVVDPSFFWGRTFDAADGLAGAGPYEVTGGGEGLLLVSTAEGIYRYRLDQDQPAARTWFEGDPAAAAAAGRLSLKRVEQRAPLRYRLNGHHVTRALPPETDFGHEPGRHQLEVYAYDRDLRPTTVLDLSWRVPYPFYYSKVFVLALALASALGCSAFFLLRYRKPAVALASSAVLLALGLQVLAGVVPHAKGWPFVGFGMYSRSTPARGIVTEEALYGRHPNGRWYKLQAIQLDVAVDTLLQIIRPLVRGGAPAASEYVASWERLHPGQELTGLQVQVRRLRLLPDGPVPIAPLILVDWRKGERDV